MSTIVFAIIAIFVVWKLWSVLGTRNGAERPPFDPTSSLGPGPGRNGANGAPADGAGHSHAGGASPGPRAVELRHTRRRRALEGLCGAGLERRRRSRRHRRRGSRLQSRGFSRGRPIGL